jgi:hypothetical protein
MECSKAVLLVSANVLVAEEWQRGLSWHGHTVEVAFDDESTQRQLRNRKFDFILHFLNDSDDLRIADRQLSTDLNLAMEAFGVTTQVVVTNDARFPWQRHEKIARTAHFIRRSLYEAMKPIHLTAEETRGLKQKDGAEFVFYRVLAEMKRRYLNLR